MEVKVQNFEPMPIRLLFQPVTVREYIEDEDGGLTPLVLTGRLADIEHEDRAIWVEVDQFDGEQLYFWIEQSNLLSR